MALLIAPNPIVAIEVFSSGTHLMNLSFQGYLAGSQKSLTIGTRAKKYQLWKGMKK